MLTKINTLKAGKSQAKYKNRTVKLFALINIHRYDYYSNQNSLCAICIG